MALRPPHPPRRRHPQVRHLLLAVPLALWAAAGLCPPPAAAQGRVPSGFRSVSPDAKRARSLLAGIWIGSGRRFTFGTDALEANLDPDMPFQWDPVSVIDVTGPMVTFEVGRDRYLALIENGTMTVTRAGSPESWTLHKSPPAAQP